MANIRTALGALLITMAAANALSVAPFVSTSAAAAEQQTLKPAAEVGKPAPNFTLADTNGKQHSLSEYKGHFVVLEWNNPDCPFVKKHYSSGNMQGLQSKYTAKGVDWLSINSSAAGKNGSHTPAELNTWIKDQHASPTAYLIDESGKVGRMYGATATPHMFVIDNTGKLVYAGAIDDKNTADAADIKTAKNYVVEALDAAMAAKPVPISSTKAYGCRVHYQ